MEATTVSFIFAINISLFGCDKRAGDDDILAQEGDWLNEAEHAKRARSAIEAKIYVGAAEGFQILDNQLFWYVGTKLSKKI